MHRMKAGVLSALFVALAACSTNGDTVASSADNAPVAAGAAVAGEDLSGVWTGFLTDPEEGRKPIRLVLDVNGTTVGGTLSGGPPDGSEQRIASGEAQGSKLAFVMKIVAPDGSPFTLTFKGDASSNKIQGTWGGDPKDKFAWEVSKISGQSAARTSASPAAADLNGVWLGFLANPQGGPNHPITLNLKFDGGSVTGSLGGGPPDGSDTPVVNGKLQGDQISFETHIKDPAGKPTAVKYKGRINGNRIQGTHGIPGMVDNVRWEATKH